jgi:hypothetical protein
MADPQLLVFEKNEENLKETMIFCSNLQILLTIATLLAIVFH